jgi:hypothetical protein
MYDDHRWSRARKRELRSKGDPHVIAMDGWSWRVNDRIDCLRKLQDMTLSMVAALEQAEARRLSMGGLEFDKKAEQHRRSIASLRKEAAACAKLEEQIRRDARDRVRRMAGSRARGADAATILRFDPARRET